MNTGADIHSQLRALMTEALETCQKLRNYTDDNFNVFLGDDDQKILDTINEREHIIDRLMRIESQIDLILDEVREYAKGNALPEDIDEIRRSARIVLGDIKAKDMEIMKIISSKMQTLKTETLKVRNKKKLSAYMKTSFAEDLGDSVNLSK
jgi:hypothetical protein